MAVVLAGQLQQTKRLAGAERVPGGVMQHTGGEVQAGAMFGQQLFEGVEIEAIRAPLDRHHLDPVQGQVGVEVEVAGRVEQHRVAGAGEQAHEHVQALQGVGRGDDLLHRHRQPFGMQFVLQCLAQRQEPGRRAHPGKAQRRRAHHATHGLAKRLAVQPLLRQMPATGAQISIDGDQRPA